MRKDIVKIGAVTLASVMFFGTVLSGCGKSESSKKVESGRFKFITAMSDEARTEVINTVVGKLQEKYPDVDFINESGEDFNNKAKRAFSSGDGYELVLTDDLGLSSLRDAGYLLDLNKHVEERGWVEKQLEGAGDFYNQRTPGERYTVGTNYAPVIVYYNKTIFKELNLEVPKTVGEFENVLKTATEKGYIGAENCKDNVNVWLVESLVQNKAPFEDVLDWYYLKESKESVGSAFKESAELVKKWSDAGYYRKDYEGIEYGDIPSLFGQGKTAMSINGNWCLPEYESTGLDIGIFAFPGVEDSTKDNYIINPVDAAFAVGKHVNETQLNVALDFIDLMLSPEIAAMWLERGAIPSAKCDIESIETTDLTKELLNAISNTKSGFYLNNMKPGFLELFIKELQLCVAGEESPDVMWTKFDEFWNEK